MANKQIKDYKDNATAARGDYVFTQTADLTKYNAPTVATLLGLLSGDDLPTMPVSKGGTNVTSLTASRILKSAADGLSVGTLTGTGFLKLTSDVPSVAALARADMPTGALFCDAAISSTAQYIEDKDGNASALALSSSNVGIGTTSPGAKLEVNSGQANIRINSTYAGQGNASLLIDRSLVNRNAAITYRTNNSDGSVTDEWYTGLLYDSTDAANWKYSIGRTSILQDSKFVIDLTGNVGIGTTSPGAKLHVNGNIRCVLPTSSSGLSSGDLWCDTSDSNRVKMVT